MLNLNLSTDNWNCIACSKTIATQRANQTHLPRLALNTSYTQGNSSSGVDWGIGWTHRRICEQDRCAALRTKKAGYFVSVRGNSCRTLDLCTFNYVQVVWISSLNKVFFLYFHYQIKKSIATVNWNPAAVVRDCLCLVGKKQLSLVSISVLKLVRKSTFVSLNLEVLYLSRPQAAITKSEPRCCQFSPKYNEVRPFTVKHIIECPYRYLQLILAQ